MGIFNELSKDFNGGFNPAENLGQVIELMNKYGRIRTRTGGFNPIIYNSWHKKEEPKIIPRTVSVNELEAAINATTRPQAGYIDMENNNTSMPQIGTMPTSNVGQVELDTEDIMDM